MYKKYIQKGISCIRKKSTYLTTTILIILQECTVTTTENSSHRDAYVPKKNKLSESEWQFARSETISVYNIFTKRSIAGCLPIGLNP